MSFLPAVLTAVGAGVSFIGGQQQASAAQAIANQNAQIQAANARFASESEQTQANILKSQTDANYRLRSQEAQQHFANADAAAQRAGAQDAINAENIRRKREEGERLTAAQRARFAASGVVESTGSPLSLLAETAGLIQRDIGEQTYYDDLAQQGLYHDAALERLGGKYAIAGATLDKTAGLSEVGLRNATADQTLLTGLRQSELTRLGGRSQARGLRLGAYGNLLTGGASAFSKLPSFQPGGRYAGGYY